MFDDAVRCGQLGSFCACSNKVWAQLGGHTLLSMTVAVAKLWISKTHRVGGVFKGHSYFTQVRKGVRVVQDGVVCMMRAFGMLGELGPSSLCPTGVLPLLDVIAATTGYDVAVVEGGTVA